MNEEDWLDILNRSDSLRAVRPSDEGVARGAVRIELMLAANRGEGPVGLVAGPGYLIAEPLDVEPTQPAPGSADAEGLDRLKTLAAKYDLVLKPKRPPAQPKAKEVPAPAPPAPAPPPPPPPTVAAEPARKPVPTRPETKGDLYAMLAAAAQNTAKDQGRGGGSNGEKR